jgi:hypothetical protein
LAATLAIGKPVALDASAEERDEAAVVGIDRELHVGAAGFDADLAQHRDRGVAHDLEFLVGQRQRRGDGDGIAGMHAHRIEILDRADDDAIVGLVAHHLHLEFLPAEHAFFDQHLGGGRGVEPALDDLEELLLVERDAAAGAGEREGGADDGGDADVFQRVQRLDQALGDVAALALGLAGRPGALIGVDGMALRLGGKARRRDPGEPALMQVAIGLLQIGGVGERGFRRLQADPLHRLAKQFAVLGLVDRLGGGSDHGDAVLLQHPHPPQRQGAVQRGLAAHGRQQRVGAFLLDDLGDDLRRDRLDIGGVGDIGIGHDGRRVGIDQHDPVALFLEGLAGLGAGIVELAGLADDDRTGADDEDG